MSTTLRNARLGGDVVDVRIDAGVIESIGSGLAASAEEIDLDGRWLVPGLWDNHTHFSQWALVQRRLDVGAAGSAREAAQLVGRALAAEGLPPVGESGQPLPFVAMGFRDALWPDAPTLAVLDAVSANLPIVLVSGDLHAVWLNTPALELYGHSGHETGLLREEPAFRIEGLINAVPDAVLDPWVDSAARAAAARGVVGIVDLEMDWNLDAWQRRMAAGTDALRIEFGIYATHLDRAIALGLRTGQRVNELLTVGMHKIITDGSLNTRTAYCYDEYPGLHGQANSRGLLTVEPSELLELMGRASAAGIVPTVHAIGDHANALALDAFTQLGIVGRIEHAQLLSDADVARFGALGVVASVQPEHAMDDRDVADKYWVGRTRRAFALSALLEAGAELALGSDAPVAPLDPWVTIAAAVDRGRDGRAPWHPEQAITCEQALRASARTRVAVGEVADLAIVEADPATASTATLRAMPVAGTLLSGRWTHRGLD